MFRRFAEKTLTRIPISALIITLTIAAILLPAIPAGVWLNAIAQQFVGASYGESLALSLGQIPPVEYANIEQQFDDIEASIPHVLEQYICTVYLYSDSTQAQRSYNLEGTSYQPFPFSAEDMAEVDTARDGILFKTSLNRGRLLIIRTTVEPSLRLYLIFPIAQFSTAVSRFWVAIGMMFLGIFLLVLLVNFVLVKIISDPIKKLLFSMRNPALSLNLAPYDSWGNEMGKLCVAYSHRVEANQENLSKVNEFNDRKREFEIEALQNQINSHFIYNTLNNIQWLALAGRTDDVIATAKSLDNLLRACAHNENEIVTIEEELSYVESYLSAQKIRFGDVFDYEFDLDMLMMQMKIPKFILQPIVENSIYHGFLEGNRKNGMIKISVKRRGHRIDIKVTDNGIGIERERLQTVLDNEYKSSGRFMGVALGNVNKRIKLLCGKEYGLGIQSRYGHYTTTEIVIPIIV